MLILRFICENNPRIIAASGADPENGAPGSCLPIYTRIL